MWWIFSLLNILCFITCTFSQTVTDSRCQDTNGQKVCFSTLSGVTTYHQAVQWCQALGATLPRPNNAMDAQDLGGYISSAGLSSSWIDAKQNKLPWTQVVGFSPVWVTNRPTDNDNYESCVVLRAADGYQWDQAPCTQTHAVVCEANTNDVPQGFGCEPIDATRCILAQNIQQSWYDADKAICSAFGNGGRLVRVTDSTVNDLVINKARSLGVDVWVGMTNRPWITADGGELSYYYWDTDNPSTVTDQCAAATNAMGRWIDASCDDQLRVVCQGDTLLSTTTTTTTTTTTATTTSISPTTTTTTTTGTAVTGNDQSCSLDPVLLTSQSGSFSSPGYPRSYGAGLGCIWQVKAVGTYSGYRIEIEFSDMDLDCSAGDQVTVYTGKSQNSYCRDQPPPTVIATDLGTATVYLRTSAAPGTGKGFNAKYRIVNNISTKTTTTSRQTSPTTTLSTTLTPTLASCERQPVLFTAQSGSFSSPGYPNGYNINQNCIWQIQTAAQYPGYAIELDFTDIDLGCPGDDLIVYYDTKQISLCDSPITSISAQLGSVALSLRTDANPEILRGFSANYRVVSPQGSSSTTTTPTRTPPTGPPSTRTPSPVLSTTSTTNQPFSACGGVLTNESGIISSPGYPNSYPPEITCLWTIDATTSRYRIELEFVDIDVDCSDDFSVYIVNTVENLCGTSVPPKKVSYSGKLHLILKTDASISGRGFQARYRIVPDTATSSTTTTLSPTTATTTTPTPHVTGPTTAPLVNNSCIQTLRGTSGTVTSPGYPGQYPDNSSCTWTIQAPAGQLIQLEVMHFDIESSPGCGADEVVLIDGRSILLGRFCGTVIPKTITSTENTLTVIFNSNANISGPGFAFSYKQLKKGSTSSPITDVSSMPTAATTTTITQTTMTSTMTTSTIQCSGTLDNITGILTSPGYPGNYPNQLFCEWLIIAPSGDRIELIIEDFNLEKTTNCSGDYMAVIDSDRVLIGMYCGRDVPESVESTGNTMSVVFVTDSQNTDKGFSMLYRHLPAHTPTTNTPGFTSTSTAKPNECGGILKNSSGVITSPQYPDSYPNSLNCQWTISGEAGSLIRVDIQDFDVEYSAECRSDFLIVLDSDNSLLGWYCGDRTRIPNTITSTGNSMTAILRTNEAIGAAGFKLNYRVLKTTDKTPTPISTTASSSVTSSGIPSVTSVASGQSSTNIPTSITTQTSTKSTVTKPTTTTPIANPTFTTGTKTSTISPSTTTSTTTSTTVTTRKRATPDMTSFIGDIESSTLDTDVKVTVRPERYYMTPLIGIVTSVLATVVILAGIGIAITLTKGTGVKKTFDPERNNSHYNNKFDFNKARAYNSDSFGKKTEFSDRFI